jgi:hypothetical protein
MEKVVTYITIKESICQEDIMILSMREHEDIMILSMREHELIES